MPIALGLIVLQPSINNCTLLLKMTCVGMDSPRFLLLYTAQLMDWIEACGRLYLTIYDADKKGHTFSCFAVSLVFYDARLGMQR